MSQEAASPLPQEKPKAAAAPVRAANAGFALPPDDGQDFEDARRGFLGTVPDGVVPGAGRRPAWDMRAYAFLDDPRAPESVNPSLWRQARLNAIHGLFEVMPGVYQVRGLDLANMTLIEGETGVIVIDALTTRQTAAAAIALYRAHRGERPVTGVIYTHTHTDHWGGAEALVDPADAAAGRVPVIAPDRFLEEAVAENVTAGGAMLRRALFQFGQVLKPGPLGHVDNGLGKAMAVGTWGLVPPNDLILATGDVRVIDGVELHFQMAPETEAPAEMHIWAPSLKLLNLAENATHNFHNLLPFRGSAVRNTLDWAGYINEALEMWGGEVEALVGQHHWPTWGNAQVRAYLRIQRDLYKFTHDQTVRLMNLGLTPQEIAETIRLPDAIEAAWHARGYYGAIRHNAKAIYQHYLGWYDAVPAHLDPLPPQAGGRKMIEYMGGMEAVLARARKDVEAGEYRWAAEVLSRAVFADPDCAEARALLADVYEQLGYGCEAATWRNAYLNGALELRQGPPPLKIRSAISPQTARALSPDQLFGVLGVRLDGLAAQRERMAFTVRFTDLGQDWVLNLEHGALTWVAGRGEPSAVATLTLAKEALAAAVSGERGLEEAIEAGAVQVEGDLAALRRLLGWIEAPAPIFAVVEPKPGWDL